MSNVDQTPEYRIVTESTADVVVQGGAIRSGRSFVTLYILTEDGIPALMTYQQTLELIQALTTAIRGGFGLDECEPS